jgi:hypothetical protein
MSISTGFTAKQASIRILKKVFLILSSMFFISFSNIFSQGILPIDSLKMNDSTGVPLMVNDTISTSGIVTSILQLGTGTSGPGTIQNANTAVSVYGSVFTQTPGLQIGDSVVITDWKVTNYSGLTELQSTANSTVKIISSGHKVEPALVTISDINNEAWNGFEKYEGMYVQINGVTFADTGSSYDTFNLHTSTSGWNYHITNGTDTLIFRIVKTNTSLIGKPVPTGPVSIVGIIQQYKSTAPYNSGYEIFPLDSSSIIAKTILPIDSLKMNNNTGIPLMVNDTISTSGIVTSILQLGTGTSGPGTIQNANTAVSVYGSVFTQTPGLQIGDSVVITDWKVTNYSGLTELQSTANSTVKIISSGHKVEPALVTISDINNEAWNGFEKYEGMYVQINGVTFADTGSSYDTFNLHTSTSGWNYHITNGTDTLIFRIVKTNTSLIGKPVPTGPVSIVGIIQQYKSTAPYNSGYEIFPLDSSSILISVNVEENQNKNYSYNLFQNYPNPFNPSTTISFSVPCAQKVELTVYDIMGRKVATLFNSVAHAGITNVNFNAAKLASGVYIYSIKTNTKTMTKKLMLLK